jgi:hypothetical protein
MTWPLKQLSGVVKRDVLTCLSELTISGEERTRLFLSSFLYGYTPFLLRHILGFSYSRLSSSQQNFATMDSPNSMFTFAPETGMVTET